MGSVPAKKICIIRLSALGDIVNTSAFVNRLRKGYPDAHITWILQPLTYDLVKNNNSVDRCIIFDRKGGIDAWKSIAAELADEYFDLVFMLQVSLKASMISFLVKGDVKLGFDFSRSREMQWLFSNRKIPASKPAHVLDQFFEFLDYAGVPDCPVDWGFSFTEDEIAFRDDFFKPISRPVISFVIASSNVEKDWHAEGYAEVMDYVDSVLGFQPMIIGGPSSWEKELADHIVSLCRCEPVIALEKPIRKTLVQLAGSAVVVAPDTGPMHMAVALNVPTVALYGYSDPRRCGPYMRFQDLLIDKYNLPEEFIETITRKTKKGRTGQITAGEVIEKIELAVDRYVTS